MDSNKGMYEIRKDVTHILSILANDRISIIERDIILEKLRKLYEDVLSIHCGSADESYLQKSHEPTEKVSLSENAAEDFVTMEELIEKPVNTHAPIAKSIIESLYGDQDLCKSENQDITITDTDNEQGLEREDSGTVLHEALAGQTAPDIASMLSAQAASQLRNAIGLNDRLMLLNDLFGNDPDLYEKTINKLEVTESLEDAFIYLYENFTMDDSKDGVKLLISLLEAKFQAHG